MSDWRIAHELRKHVPVLYVDPLASHLTRIRNPDAAQPVRRPRLRTYKDGLPSVKTSRHV
jgi:hypothetical protein